MTARKKPAYDEAATYDVKLIRLVIVRGSRFLPLHAHEMSGRFLNEVVAAEGADVVDRADPHQ